VYFSWKLHRLARRSRSTHPRSQFTMEKKITILKMGSLYPALEQRRGSFEDYILKGMGINKDQALIPWVYRGDDLPAYEQISGVIITGSLAMVSDRLDWSEKAAKWLAGAVHRRIPTLGICYGHQLLAHALGGEAANNPKGWEVGTVNIYLPPQAAHDPLFNTLPLSFPQHVFHRQSALSLPPGATLLASSALDPHHAFVVDGCAWGVQFHPEFDREIQIFNIEQERKMLIQQGLDPENLLATLQECPTGPILLEKFAKLCLVK